jgi:predicted negative regulator of RcsB-dependent stress response
MQIVQMLKNVQDKDALDNVLSKFEQLGKGQTIYSTLANIAIANISDALGNYNKAIYYYGLVAGNAKADKGFKVYSHLMKVASSLRSQKVTVNEALAMLDDSGNRSNAAFYRSQTLLKASLLIEMGKKDEARAILKTLTDHAINNSDGGAAELLLSLTYTASQ